VFYQVDTWQGSWVAATNQGNGLFTATSAALAPGLHIMYAYATDGQEASPTMGSGVSQSPLISNIAAFEILVSPLPITGFVCNGYYSGTFVANVEISTGQTCQFVGGGISGNITVIPGGTLVLDNATATGSIASLGGSVILSNSSANEGILSVAGNLTLNNATVGSNVQIIGGAFSIDPSTIKGSLQVQGLLPGSAASSVCGTNIKGNLEFDLNLASLAIGSSSCPGNIVGGSLLVNNNGAPVTIFNNSVVGNLQDLGNLGPTQVVGNTVGGNLQVQNNKGSAQVSNNNVKDILSCVNNASIAGSGNTAMQKQGQCATF
jgi:hypothetical protein